MTTLLRSCAEIIQDKAYQDFDVSYTFSGMTFSPTVYELIKRYEFIATKRENSSNVKEDLIQDDMNDYNNENL